MMLATAFPCPDSTKHTSQLQKGISIAPPDEINFAAWSDSLSILVEETPFQKTKHHVRIVGPIDSTDEGYLFPLPNRESDRSSSPGRPTDCEWNGPNDSNWPLRIAAAYSANPSNMSTTTTKIHPDGAPVPLPNLNSVLKSSLKTCNGSGDSRALATKRSGRGTTERRVRGLWSSTGHLVDCPWSLLRDETLIHVFSFLNLTDALHVGMLSKRYRAIVQDKSLWRSVDATEFVERVNDHFLLSTGSTKAAQAQTGKALQRIFLHRSPSSFTVRNIHGRLSADDLPSFSGLQQLTLTHFENLSDTHVHVLLLMNHSVGMLKAPLRKLALEHCPKLTNTCVRSIASQCPSLESLSLRSCHGITKIDQLRHMLATNANVTPHVHSSAPIQPISLSDRTAGLSGLFAAPPSRCFSVKRANQEAEFTSRHCSTGSLEGLFVIPARQMSQNRSTPFSSGGSLREVDLQGSGVTPVAMSTLLGDT
jgi:hypothetical protein